MLKLEIPAGEIWDESKQEFFEIKNPIELALEHSLVSISKWESKWKKSFLSSTDKTNEEMIDYIRCMTLTQNVDPKVYYCIPPKLIFEINNYINDPMTATTFTETQKKPGAMKNITSEQIYSWMVAYNIPFECQKWHLARLLTLIRVCALANEPKKKMSARDIMSRNAALNKARRTAMHSKG